MKIKFFKLIFIYLILIILLLNCSGPETTGNISIQVLDDSTYSPIPYVSIKLGYEPNTWGATGICGVAIFMDVPVGKYNAKFYAAKYKTSTYEIEIKEDDQTMDVLLHRIADIDTICPYIVDAQVEDPDIYILFNEGMNRNSVMKSILEHKWYIMRDSYFGFYEVYDSYFHHEWKGDNLLIIKHEKETENYEFWRVKKVLSKKWNSIRPCWKYINKQLGMEIPVELTLNLISIILLRIQKLYDQICYPKS